MDVVSYRTLSRCLERLSLADDLAGGLDARLEALLDELAGLPGPTRLAVVLIDDGGRPGIRAGRGDPDMGLVADGALSRGGDPFLPRVLRRGAAPVWADADGTVAATRRETAMLAAPVVADGAVVGCFFADTLLGPDAPLDADVRLTSLVAGIVGRMVAVAGRGVSSRREMSRELAYLRSKVSLRYQHVFSTGTSQLLDSLRSAADRVALLDDPVILEGEAGTGRTVLARLIHELSPRAVKPFLLVPDPEADDLAERLFGGRGPGLLEAADGGSLLVADAPLLPPDVAGRLARLLKDGVFVRQDSGRERRADVRLFFKAPPQGLGPELAAAARMRTVRLPSLRQRREDVPALLEYFLGVGEQRAGRRLGLTAKALKALEAYDWPGNIREMEALVAKLSLTATGDRIDIADIPPEILAEGERPPVLPEDAAELRDMERQQVVSALERHGWVQSRAARELGLTLRQIGYRIRKYGLTREKPGGAGTK